jgi:hypothetical protein
MPYFSKGKIYEVKSSKGDEVYVGSTTQTLTSRMNTHKGHYQLWEKGEYPWLSIFDLFEEYGVETFHISLIEDFPCHNSKELHIRENHWIKEKKSINLKYAHAGPEEKREQQRNTKRRQHANKPVIQCPCGGVYRAYTYVGHVNTQRHQRWQNRPKIKIVMIKPVVNIYSDVS